ncbi:MAG: PAS domain-containing protein, partial [Candidatus Omnitrophica bacterium]|nr:PAS domain-containing protein [Candidatus Omnitrophota bacterium]
MEDSKQNNLEITAGLLRKAELQQKAILDNIPDIAWLKDLQGRFIAVNELFAKACGLKVEEIIGKTDLDIWPKELALSYRANDQEVIDSKKRKCIQEKLVYPKGSEQWMETIKAPFFDDYGKVIGTTGISRNITLHKNEAERLKEIRAELDLRVKVRTSELASFNEALRKEVRFAQEAQKENDEKLEVLVQQRTKSLELEIAARKEAEEKANILYQQLEFILGATKTGLDIIDKDYNLRYVDPVWACNYGDWRGKKCFEYFMGRKSSCPECAIEEAFSTKKIVISEETLTREGDRPIQVTTIPYQDKNGEWLVV